VSLGYFEADLGTIFCLFLRRVPFGYCGREDEASSIGYIVAYSTKTITDPKRSSQPASLIRLDESQQFPISRIRNFPLRH